MRLSSICAYLILTACAHSPSLKPTHSGPNVVQFAAMGTVWKIEVKSHGKSVLYTQMSEDIKKIVFDYDLTFSDWTDESELRKLEKKDLTQFQSATPLFLKGLTLSQEMFKQSGGYFDVTVGAVLWKELERPVGMDKLEIKADTFRFKFHPQRLTFGGIVKGMAVGEIASYLHKGGHTDFHIDAGGGNLAFASPSRLKEEGVTFVSNSFTKQKGRNHILNPKSGTLKEQGRIVTCHFPPSTVLTWADNGGRTDAYSKIIMMNEKFILPKNCENKELY